MANVLLLKFPYSSTYGGGEQHTLTLVERLGQKHRFFLLSTCRVLLPEFAKRGWQHQAIWAGTEPVTLSALILFLFTWPIILISLLWWLIRYKLRYQIDTLFCLSLTEKVLLTPCARLLGMRVIWMEHLQIERWLLASPLRLPYILWSRLATVVTVVAAVKDQLIQLGVPAKQIQVIYNAVDVSQFTPSPSRVEDLAQHFRVLFVGRLASEKGLDDLLQAVHIVRQHIPHIQLNIVGEGTLRPTLEQLTQQLGLTECVTFSGFSTHIPAVLKQCDVLVLPSTRRETFGIVLAEALATIKPVIATTTGGLTEIVDQFGWSVPPHTPTAIAAALLDVYEHYDLALNKASAGRQRVLELFQVDRMVTDYDTLFSSN
ncbi:MAG: glycosyltransferase [Candidatus Kerfeldbacteria bacterium]|nr:glycosyltransferase [Candidatus Kerfeldbacteria bacterium]